MDISKEQVRGLVQNVVALIITLIVLGVINAVIKKLPAMETIVFEHIAIADISSAMISLVIICVLLITGQNIALKTSRLLPSVSELSSLISNLANLVAIIVAYKSFDTIVLPYFDKLDISWLYPVLFLLIASMPIYKITVVLISNSGQIADVFIQEKKITASAMQTVACPGCGSQVHYAKFCSSCGCALPEKTSHNCVQCGAELKPGANFCTACGCKATQSA